MDPQLETLVAGPDGMQVLIGNKLEHHLPGHPKPFWCWPTALNDTGKAFWVQDELYRQGPFPVPLDQLAIEIGKRDPTDPLIQLLRRKGMDVSPFLKPVAPPAPLNIPAPPVATPGVGFATPMPTFGPGLPAEQTQAFQRALLHIVQRGSLTDMMDSMITDYGTAKEWRAWRSKVKYLMDVYKEGDPKVAHVKAGVLSCSLLSVQCSLDGMSLMHIH
jgi:hypothetical protein